MKVTAEYKREKMRQWRVWARANHVCIDCRGKLLDEWKGWAACPECRERRSAASARRLSTKKGLEASRTYQREWSRRQRQRPGVLAAQAEAKRAAQFSKKIRQVCLQCSGRTKPDCLWCAKCHERVKEHGRMSMRRKRAMARGERVAPIKRKRAAVIAITTRLIKPCIAPTPKPETVTDKVLKLASRFDEFSNEDLREATGLSSNRISTELRRLRLRGAIVKIRGGHGANDTAYRISREDRMRAA
jgi:biotin operon repressor